MPDIIRQTPTSKKKYRYASATIVNELDQPKSISLVGQSVKVDIMENTPIIETKKRERGIDFTLAITKVEDGQQIPTAKGLRTVTITDPITQQQITISGVGIMEAMSELISIEAEPIIDAYIISEGE